MESTFQPQHEALVNLAKLAFNDWSWERRSSLFSILENSLHLTQKEDGDTDVIIAAVLFHNAAAGYARNMLEWIGGYTHEQIVAVEYAIEHCRESNEFAHHTVESEVLRNAILIEELMVA